MPKAPNEVMYRIVAPHFVAGVILDDERVVRCAPIVKYMKGWTANKVVAYCNRKKWTAERMP